MAILRKYFLGSYGGLTEHSFTLIFDDKCNMYIRCRTDYEQPYKKDQVSDVEIKNIDNIKIEGVPLRDILKKKLEEILPPSNPPDSPIPPNWELKE